MAKRLSKVKRERAHEVLRAIRRIIYYVSEHSRRLHHEVGLTVPQLLVLKAVGELETDEPELTLAAVSKHVALSPATVSRVLDRLVNAGLVERERRAKDRRKVCLTLTDAGWERFQALPTPLQDEFVRKFDALPASERERLLGALDEIAELMGAGEVEAEPVLLPGDVRQDP